MHQGKKILFSLSSIGMLISGRLPRGNCCSFVCANSAANQQVENFAGIQNALTITWQFWWISNSHRESWILCMIKSMAIQVVIDVIITQNDFAQIEYAIFIIRKETYTTLLCYMNIRKNKSFKNENDQFRAWGWRSGSSTPFSALIIFSCRKGDD